MCCLVGTHLQMACLSLKQWNWSVISTFHFQSLTLPFSPHCSLWHSGEPCSTVRQEAQPSSWKTLPLSMAITGMGLLRLRGSLGRRGCGKQLAQPRVRAAGSRWCLLTAGGLLQWGSSCLLGTISMFGRAGYCRCLVKFSSAWYLWRFWLAFLLGVRVMRPGHQLCNAN